MRTTTNSLVSWFLVLLCALLARADDNSKFHTSSFDSAGVRIAYVEAGQGEPVILVHGLYSSAEMNWVLPGTFKLLAEHYHVIAPDLRGHGNSDKPTDEAAYGQPMVEDIVRLMDHLKIPKAHVVGYSLGGIIVMKFMVDHPERVICGSLGGMGWLREGSFEQAAFERMGERNAGKTPPACVHGIARLALTEAQLKSVKPPIEVLVGDRDPCKRMYVEPLQVVRKDIPVVIIEDAGHLTCVGKPQFKTELEKWIAKNAK
jgi:pimeloyl-ACP methyl ester carboxylesterase